MKKQKALQHLHITENNRNKETIKEKRLRKNKKGIDPEINKIVSCGESGKNISCATQR